MLIPYNEIRSHYEYLTPLILERSKKHPGAWVSPYCGDIDWIKIFTPIEDDTWHAIRSNGKIPLYPQYPVLKYFTDFANPYLKIIVECDGADYHLDWEKDNNRDYELMEAGWKVYRISGTDCYRVPSEKYFYLLYHFEEDRSSILNDFYANTVDGLIRALSIVYCKDGYYIGESISELNIAQVHLKHRLSKPTRDGQVPTIRP
jgi:hypothetical protein